MTTPTDVARAGVSFYAVKHLAVNGVRTPGACIGVLKPRVLIDRDFQRDPGFDALCYHESTHAYEFHRLTANIIILAALIPAAVAIAAGLGFVALLTVPWVAAYVIFSRAMETRADGIALYGAGHREFYAFLRKIGPQRSRWGRWCYGGSIEERTRRASAFCAKRGWSVTA